MAKPKITDKKQISEILELHNSKEPISKIAEKFSVYPQVITNILKKYKDYKPESLSLKNINYFEKIDTHTKAYLLGFIAADGAIVKQELTITIHEKDRLILDILKSELESSNDIQEIKKESLFHVRFTTSNETLINHIKSFGITENKSLIMPNIIQNIPNEFKNSFILGYFDGDGSINVREVFYNKCYSRKQSVQIRATKDFALGIIQAIGIEAYSLTEETTPSLKLSSIDEIKRFYNAIYKDCPIFLSRKRDKFLIAIYRQINKSLYRNLYNQHISQDQTISYSY